jgi:uncharacterized protein YkuJ
MRKISKLASLVVMTLFLAQSAFSDNAVNLHMISVNFPDNETVKLSVTDSATSTSVFNEIDLPAIEYSNPEVFKISYEDKKTGYTVSVIPFQDDAKTEKAMIFIDYTHLDGIENVTIEGHESKLAKVSGCSDSIIVKMKDGAKAKSKKCEITIKVTTKTIYE